MGLSSRAAGLYAKAVGVDPDISFLQYRYAVQLVALGRFEEAAAHFARADELLADGSDRLIVLGASADDRFFDTAWTRAIAERVFVERVAHDPGNPRLHYLLGILRSTQHRTVEAAREFRETVRLDPDYFYAWVRLANEANDPPDRDRAAVNILRLDPRGLHRHGVPDVSSANDLKALWPALEQAAEHRLPAPADLYPLAASGAELARQRKSQSPASEKEEKPEPPDLAGTALQVQIYRSDPPRPAPPGDRPRAASLDSSWQRSQSALKPRCPWEHHGSVPGRSGTPVWWCS